MRGGAYALPAGGTAENVFGDPGEAQAGIPSKSGSATGDESPVVGHVFLETATPTFQQLAVVGEKTLRAHLFLCRHNLLASGMMAARSGSGGRARFISRRGL
jgi:hypothetical protein